MAHFFCKLLGPRPTFPADMTAEERAVMGEHQQYLKEQLDRGTVVLFGPVMDPKGAFGIAVIDVPDMDAAQRFTADDPTIRSQRGFKYEISPMRAIFRGATN
jgi:uncharacterized protein YciI